jgi:hypothetical protein
MGGACSPHAGDEKYTQHVYLKFEEKGSVWRPNGRIILKCIL